MRRLILLSVNNSWNVVNFRTDIVRRLQNEGFDVGVISPSDTYASRLGDFGIAHYPAAIDSKGLSPTADLRLLMRYLRILGELRPAAFLSWTVKPNIYGSIAAHALKIPVINNVSGLGTAFIRKGPLTALVSLLYRLAFSRSATVFFQNPDDRQLFLDKRLVAASRTALLPGSGIDTIRFAPSAADPCDRVVSPKAFTFLLIGRMLRDKGVMEYVEAARLLRAEGANAQFELLGSLDAENRTAISRRKLASWADEGLITYRGVTDDVRPSIAAADCIVLPSYREGMPRALLEGAALAKPLIATRVPGCTEIARDGINALLCTVRDPVSLADAMRRMVSLSPERRQAMGTASRHIATSEFDQRIVAERYLAALAATLSPGP